MRTILIFFDILDGILQKLQWSVFEIFISVPFRVYSNLFGAIVTWICHFSVDVTQDPFRDRQQAKPDFAYIMV